MPRFQLNIVSILKNGQGGPSFNLQIEAASFVDALEVAKPALSAVLEESGLIMLPPSAAASEPTPIGPATEPAEVVPLVG